MNIETIIALIVIVIITAVFSHRLRNLIEDRDRALDKCRDAQDDATRAEAKRYEERIKRCELEKELRDKLAEAEEQIAAIQTRADEAAAELEVARHDLAHANQRIENLKVSRTRCYWAKPNCRK